MQFKGTCRCQQDIVYCKECLGDQWVVRIYVMWEYSPQALNFNASFDSYVTNGPAQRQGSQIKRSQEPILHLTQKNDSQTKAYIKQSSVLPWSKCRNKCSAWNGFLWTVILIMSGIGVGNKQTNKAEGQQTDNRNNVVNRSRSAFTGLKASGVRTRLFL